jgi:hypothetical protein
MIIIKKNIEKKQKQGYHVKNISLNWSHYMSAQFVDWSTHTQTNLLYEKQFLRKPSGLSNGIHVNTFMGIIWSRPKSYG